MGTPDPGISSPQNAVERIVYVCPTASLGPSDDIDLRVLWNALVRDRWVVVVLSLLGLVGGWAYAGLAPSWYLAEARLLPEALGGRSPLGTQSTPLGEITSLAGAVLLERDMNNGTLSLLQSRDFMRGFLTDEGLVDAVCGLAGAGSDVETAVGYFTSRVISVREDQQSGIVVLGIAWKNAGTAADVANRLVARINLVSRDRAIAEATANVEFLRGQMAEAQDHSLREVISGLQEIELRKLVVAKGRPEFAFRVLESARPPAGSYRPNLPLLAGAGLVGGLMLSFGIVLIRSLARRSAK